MDITKGRNKNSRKYYKRSTKFLNCVQKHKIPKNYHSETEKLFHQSIQIANLLAEKYPAVPQSNPESCKYYILKRRFTVKQRKLGKNGMSVSHSLDQARRCKQTRINKFFIAPSSYALEVGGFNKMEKRKSQFEKMKNNPLTNQDYAVKNKLVDEKNFKPNSTNHSKKNVCIMNNELNSENALLFQCSAASLQLEPSNAVETKKTNFNEITNLTKTGEKMKKKENYNDINDILPKLMQQVTVYRILENLKQKHFDEDNSNDDVYSSMSTCSSSSSTREYYLPAVSSSTDTMKIANVLANRRLIELHNPQEEMSSIEANSNQGIGKKSYKNSYSKFSPIYHQAPLNNELLRFNAIGMKEVGLDEFKKSNNQIIKMLKDKDGFLPFFPFTNFNSLLIKNKSKKLKNYEQSSIGVQTQDNDIYEKFDDESFDYNTMKNKRIKLSKGNFIMNNNKKNNESLGITLEKIKKKPWNTLSFMREVNDQKFKNNFNKTNEEVIKILNEHLDDTYLCKNRKEKMIINHKDNISNFSNISVTRPKNKSISEDVLFTNKDKGIKTQEIKSGILKPQSSLCISNLKSEMSEHPFNFKTHPNVSTDSLGASKPTLVKLKRFFDAGFKDPKISRLILSSKTLAGESDSTIDKSQIQKNFIDNIAENRSQQKFVKSPAMLKMTTKNSSNEENKSEAKHSSNNCIFSADSIIYGSKAFQKMREKFELLKNKIQNNDENQQVQKHMPFNKERVLNPKYSWEKSFEGLNSFESNSQLTDTNYKINKNTSHSSFSINENTQHISTNNEGISDGKNYNILFPRKFEKGDHQSEDAIKELNHINDKEKTASFSNFQGKSVGIGIMNDEHELIKINSKNSSEELKPFSSSNIIKISEKGTQVNMRLVETSEKQVGDGISNAKPTTKKEETSTTVIGKVSQKAMQENNQEKGKMHNTSNQTESMLNNHYLSEVLGSANNCHGQAKIPNNTRSEATMLNNYGEPIILYNSSGYPITDLNGRILKNNLGAYLLNTNKYADVIAQQLPVFDCDLMSVTSTCFNPTKVPFVKTQYKITDRGGNPVSLFNNIGWPLTNEDGFFLHDNRGKLLVAMDSFNFPLCCSNGSPVYLQNGAMLLSQKFKFIVTKPDSDRDCTKRSCNIGRKYKNEVVSYYDKKDNEISNLMPNNYSKNKLRSESSSRKDFSFKSLNYRKSKAVKPNLKKYSFFLPTEVPELMHEFFDNKARPEYSHFRSHGGIPQSPIPIFDLEGNRLTDESGFPLKNKYGEYMLLLDKNGIALSDSCGGPIFDSNGKQLLLKDLYHMKKRPSFHYLYDRYTPPERPYIDTTTSNHKQNIRDSSDDVIPLLDLNFEEERTSEPVMNYIKENKIKTYDMNANQVHFFKNKYHRTNRIPESSNFLNEISTPTNEKHYLQNPMTMKEDLIFYETSYQEEAGYTNIYDPSNHQIQEVPYTWPQPRYDDRVSSEHQPMINNLEQYNNNYYYLDHQYPENSEFRQDAEIRYYFDDNNYLMYY